MNAEAVAVPEVVVAAWWLLPLLLLVGGVAGVCGHGRSGSGGVPARGRIVGGCT